MSMTKINLINSLMKNKFNKLMKIFTIKYIKSLYMDKFKNR